MALLRDGSMRGALPRVAIAAVVLTAASCALAGVFGGGEEPGLQFSHRIHYDEGLECGDCHMGWEDSDDPGIPVMAGCMLCHESMEDEETPPEKRIETLFDEEGNFRAKRLTALSDEIIFSHMQHATSGLECSDCHVGIEESDAIDENVVVTMSDCRDCHSEKQAPNDCSTCHSRLDVDVPPVTHDLGWKKIHGRIVRSRDDALVNDCSLCHTEQTCVSCHRSEEPESHNNYFRLRGHGIQASIDRDSCAACHRSESCDRCHSETRPLSHSGSWGGTRSNHCLGCHFPVRSNQCFVCHKDTPSHRMAPPKPAGHVPSMNCRLCHGMGVRLPHADNGTDCNRCHR